MKKITVREMSDQFDEEIFNLMEANGWAPIGEERYNKVVDEYKNKYPEYAWFFCPNIGGILFDEEGNVVRVHKGL